LGAACALYLSNVDAVDIMQLGRWSSDAFLTYIRPQVMEAAKDLRTTMLSRPTYHHAPHERTNRERHPEDPMRRNNPKAFPSEARIRKAALNGPDPGPILIPRLHTF
jgi:hypothetical protein